ncbi:serine/threonine-protein kinase ATG1c isoform X1 [Sesamum indicum]|uniref:Serine/threonine-protein kinase ATG1c isoform X1 n=1 Tax=Sesamum indicum TaxID=4182 RepID=A0A8M8V319_SESIN|nr:serine/threonine-protein kinase ATG1c isoform X1 [Sesamum indicum]XP_020553478.1 serine/threonine-protein kinase ATG1c isoform X1 [Sesamum indicum]
MSQSTRRYDEVGDYMVGKQIGAGSFSTVWHARHRVHGTEVAIKEIVTARLSPKLQESLKSEIFILKRINHPNIIRLHDMIEEPGKMYIILEYCKGGDLSMYIQQSQGRVPEATAKHFMQQLAEGLKVLRENNFIHRDLKPQNLLLSTDGDNCILKIADFGFARSLQPRGLAETLCGSPLYMAPEIMQLQKYDAKADLWSVGTILYQLVTGKTPFTGSNQIHLLQNIIRSTDLQFPPEAKHLSPHCTDLCKKLLQRNPVARLTFEEFFNHPYLSQKQPDGSIRNRQSERVLGGFPPAERNTGKTLKEDCLPFSLRNLSSSPDGSTSFHNKTQFSKYSYAPHKTEITGSSLGSRCLSEGNLRESLKNTGLELLDNHPKVCIDLIVMDSLESIVQDYVIVSGPLMDLSSLAHASKPSHFPSKSGSSSLYSGNMNSTPSASELIIGGATGIVDYTGVIEHRLSAPGISQGSMDIADTLEQPLTDCMTLISSLQCSAAAITELVNDKIEGGKHLEAFSVQLVVLAIWKKALHICHAHAASATEGRPSQQRRFREVSKVQYSPDSQKSHDSANAQGQLDIYAEIERAFLHEVGHAEELAELIEPGNMEMPDAMELIYQSALALGRRGAVDEYMGDVESAVVFYSKAVCLLLFLLKEAACLIVNPPFSLTNSDRYRIQSYIDVLNNRQSISRSQRMVVLKAEDQSCTT